MNFNFVLLRNSIQSAKDSHLLVLLFVYVMTIISSLLSLQTNWLLHHEASNIASRLLITILVGSVAGLVSFFLYSAYSSSRDQRSLFDSAQFLTIRASLLHCLWMVPIVKTDWLKNTIGSLIFILFIVSLNQKQRVHNALLKVHWSFVLIVGALAAALASQEEFYISVIALVLRITFTLSVLFLPGFYLTRVFFRKSLSISASTAIAIPVSIAFFVRWSNRIK